jgi:predicted extracellular nuclease
MRKLIFLAGFLFIAGLLKAQVNHIVISQIYGGGGNSTAVYKNDFIELFNPTDVPISVTGWSVQYASSSGSSWQKTDLAGNIPAHGYFLIQESSGTGGTQSLPLADVAPVTSINMSATAGKVALVSNNTLIPSGTSCPSASIVDFVGFGTGTNCFEGAVGPTASASNTNSVFRKNNGCTDSDNNNADFITGSANPRNSSSPVNVCSTGCTPPGNQGTNLLLNTTTQTISGSFTSALPGSVNADSYLVLMSTSSTLSEQPVSGTAYNNGSILGNAQIVSNGSSTSFTASGLTPGVTYYFFIYSYSSTGNCYNLSNPLTGNASTNSAPTLNLTAGNNASESGTAGSFTINLSAPSASDVSITYSFTGSATFNTDYTISFSTGSSNSGSASGILTIPAGTNNVTVSITALDDALLEGTESVLLNLSNVTGGYNLSSSSASIQLNDNEIPRIVLNEIYGGGGNSGAIYKNDYIELFNNEPVPINLAGWSVQYQSASGTGNWNVTPLSGSIPAHGYYLIQETAGSGGTTNLPTADVAGSIAMGATSGKVLLSNSTTPAVGANPSGDAIIDKVGYGPATGFETAPVSAPDNTTAIKRITDGADNNNNSTDFELIQPEPKNSTYTTTPPVAVSFSPSDNSTDLPYNTSLSINFNKPVQKGTGNIVLFENNVPLATLDVNSGNILISGSTVIINQALHPNKAYYIQIDATAIIDAFNNHYQGISDATTWNFSTYNSTVATILPATFDFQNCTGNGLLPNGFTQFSETGAIVWDCTPFGRDPSAPSGTAAFPNAVQINGFANGTNVPNVDWLISPSLDLTGSTYPLLSFWSRTAFNGLPLQLKISTDYPGTGDPRNYTWADLNGRFPSETSNIWTLSSGINLAAFKQGNVHIAFVYTSGSDEGARWTLDDISISNSLVPPPPNLTTGETDVQFGYAQAGGFSDKSFNFIGNDLTDDVTINSNGAFLLSKDGSTYSSSITYSAAVVNNINQSVFVRFAPMQDNLNYTGTITVSTSGLSNTITLNGTSIDPATTLEVVNWNMEWFGSTSLGPTDDDQQEKNAEIVIKNANADIYGLVEVVDESRLARIVSHMPGYAYVIGNFGSHVNPPETTGGPLGEAQKLAFVYKKSIFSNIETRPLINNQNTSSVSYNNWSSGRYPFLMKADVTLNGVTKTIDFVLIHSKANTSPTATSYARRQSAANELHDTLMTYFADANIMVLGDFNDDLDQSITAGFTTTSYSSFTNDPTNFFSPTLALSIAGKKSTVSFNDVIDHVMLSNELQPFYMPGSATVLSDVSSLVSNYGTTTSDHYPVFTRYMFCKLTVPSNVVVSNDSSKCGAIVNYTIPGTMTCGSVTAIPASGSFFPIGTTVVHVMASTGDTASFSITVNDTEMPAANFPVNQAFCYNNEGSYTIPALTATDNCGIASIEYVITGATTRAGTGDPSGLFNPGINKIAWTITDIHGNQTTGLTMVTINNPISVSIPDTKSLPMGVLANTVYPGYLPASTLTLSAVASGGTGVYNYSWSTGNTSKEISVTPISQTDYSVTVTDNSGLGCNASSGITVNVIDVRCGNKDDKVQVCHNNGEAICISSNAVASQLINGDFLGICTNSKEAGIQLSLKALPNPANNYFNLNIQSNNSSLKAHLIIYNAYGNIVEQRDVVPGSTIQLGNNYNSGIYFAELTQGMAVSIITLVKISQ